MKPGSFILNGKTSESLGITIQDRPELMTPFRRIEFKSAFGQSGTVPFDEDAYNNTELELYLYVVGNGPDSASKNRDLVYNLFNSNSYLDFIPYFDENKIYKVMLLEPPKFVSKYYFREGQSVELKLTVKPYKYLVKAPKVTITSGGTIINTASQPSLPKITITGTGDITLKVNGIDFIVKNVVGSIILDSETCIAYKEAASVITNENAKTYTRAYPFLKPGTNTISWVGAGITKVEIEPRWRTLA